MEYEYEEQLEASYRDNLMRVFSKTLEDGYFTFVIIDAINDKISHFRDAYYQAKSRGFVVSACSSSAFALVCEKSATNIWRTPLKISLDQFVLMNKHSSFCSATPKRYLMTRTGWNSLVSQV